MELGPFASAPLTMFSYEQLRYKIFYVVSVFICRRLLPQGKFLPDYLWRSQVRKIDCFGQFKSKLRQVETKRSRHRLDLDIWESRYDRVEAKRLLKIVQNHLVNGLLS